MLRRIIYRCWVCAICAILWYCTVSAQTKYYGGSSGNIIQVIDNMQKKNPVVHSVFEQKVRTYANGNAIWFGKNNRLANGAWILVEAISPYMQWIIFLGMTLSVILIIYNGFVIVTNAWDDSKLKSAKGNITNILIGVLVLWGFYFILRITSGLLLNLIWW